MTDTTEGNKEGPVLSDPTYKLVQPVMYEVRSTNTKPTIKPELPQTETVEEAAVENPETQDVEPIVSEKTSDEITSTENVADERTVKDDAKDEIVNNTNQENTTEETAESVEGTESVPTQPDDTVTDDTVELDMKAILNALESQKLIRPSIPFPKPRKEIKKTDIGDIFSKFVDNMPEKKPQTAASAPAKKRGLEEGTLSYHVFMTMFQARESIQLVFDGLFGFGIFLAVYITVESFRSNEPHMLWWAGALVIIFCAIYAVILSPGWKNTRELKRLLTEHSKQQLTRKELKKFAKTIRKEKQFNSVKEFAVEGCSWRLAREGDEFILQTVDNATITA